MTSIVRIGSRPRRGAALLVALSLVMAGAPRPVLALAPTDGGPITLFPVTINASSGDQFDPHVSGGLAAYTAGDNIRYYDFSTTDDAQVPGEIGAFDQLSDISNGKIVFSRLDATFAQRIMVFDTVTSTSTEIDPQPSSLRSNGAIGSNTVAFIDFGLMPVTGELLASQLGGGTARITNDGRFDRAPSVAPLGDLIVYESCQSAASNCEIRQAGWDGSSWVVTHLTDNGEPEANPDTDGAVVVYDADRSGERDIRWQPVGGSVTEPVLSLAGEQRNPSVSAGVIAFESVAPLDGDADLFVYEIASNRLFRITSTPGLDETLSDVAVLPSGSVRVVWSSGEFPDRNVFGATFELPPVEPATRIAFTSRRDGNFEVYVMTADGTGQTRLTTHAATDGEPAWSPDGSRIAFTSSRTGLGDIYVIDADGTGLAQLTTSGQIDLSPAWQ